MSTPSLRAYVRRTILKAAVEYSYPSKRRTKDGTESAFKDALNGTDTGWWSDLIYTAPMLEMAHRYRRDIATALDEYRRETGSSFMDRDGIAAEEIAVALLRGPYSFANYQDDEHGDPEAVLIGLRFAVEWYANDLAREHAPNL